MKAGYWFITEDEIIRRLPPNFCPWFIHSEYIFMRLVNRLQYQLTMIRFGIFLLLWIATLCVWLINLNLFLFFLLLFLLYMSNILYVLIDLYFLILFRKFVLLIKIFRDETRVLLISHNHLLEFLIIFIVVFIITMLELLIVIFIFLFDIPVFFHSHSWAICENLILWQFYFLLVLFKQIIPRNATNINLQSTCAHLIFFGKSQINNTLGSKI